MNKIMSRYKGLILSCVSVLMIVVCVCSFSIESKASTSSVFGQEFTMNFPQPSTSETQGYIHLLMRRDDTEGSGYYIQTYFWSCYATTDDGSISPCSGYVILNNNSIEFVPWGSTYSDSAFYVISSITQNGTYAMRKYSFSQRYTHTFTYECVGFKYGGNALVESSFENTIPFTVYYTEDSSVALIMEILEEIDQLQYQNNYNQALIYTELMNITSGIEDTTEQLRLMVEYLESIDGQLVTISDTLDEIFARCKTIISEQRKTNTWLEKIWNSIQEFFTPDEESKEESEELENETNEKSDKLDGLNEQNKTDKTDINSASSSVDENVDLDSIGTVNNIFVYITENEYILQMLLMVFSVALVAYVLFGKK